MKEIINEERYAEIINDHIYKNNYKKFIEKISDNPSFINGDFVPLTIEEKIKYTKMHSTIIKFGDAMEEILTEYIEEIFKDDKTYKKLPKKIKQKESITGKAYSIDQLFQLKNKIYLVEQKIGDGHDSTKKDGQFNNFENKCKEIHAKYGEIDIVAIMWFMDEGMQKNKSYYQERMKHMKENYKNCYPKLCYGRELFGSEKGIEGLPKKVWDEIIKNLKLWKTSCKNSEFNLDEDYNEYIEELKSIKPEVFTKIFNNKNVVEFILPVIFPTGKVLEEYANFLKSKNKAKNNDLIEKIEEYIKNR